MLTLDAIEALADAHLPDALAALRARPQPLAPAGLLLEAELLARSGALEEAFLPLDQLASHPNADAAVLLEAQVMHASVSAGLGRFDAAIPKLESVVRALDKHPELAWLQAEATAELRAYSNLVSPKHAGTWASLLT